MPSPRSAPGCELARGEYVAVVAADLQEPPELVEGFFVALKKGSDVAVGSPDVTRRPGPSSLSSRAYWSFYRRFIIPEIPRGGVDVFAVTSQVRDQVVALRESHTSLVGMLYWLGFSRAEVPYERANAGRGQERVVAAPQGALPHGQRVLLHRPADHPADRHRGRRLCSAR